MLIGARCAFVCSYGRVSMEKLCNSCTSFDMSFALSERRKRDQWHTCTLYPKIASFFCVTEDYELKDRIGVKDEKALVAQAAAGKCICMHLLPGS
jgi:hypothetical protein